MKYYLGIDCGGTFVKAQIIDELGNIIKCAKDNIGIISNQPGYAERNMNALWSSCANIIKKVIEYSGVDNRMIVRIGISAQGKGVHLLDKNYNSLGNAILSSDRRAEKIVSMWKEHDVDKIIYPITKQNIWSGHPVSILKWIKDNDIDRYNKIEYVLMTHDYLRFCLTGNLYCEVTNISESNLYNINLKQYDEELFKLFDIYEMFGKLAPVIDSEQIAGYVTKEAAVVTGLAIGTPVIAGLFDVVAATYSAHLENEYVLNGILGTWNIISGVTNNIKETNFNLIQGKYISDKIVIHDDSPTSIGNLEWFINNFDELDYSRINKLVESIPECSSSILFIPFLYGSNFGNNISGGIYNLQMYHTTAHLFQAIYEGVIFSFKYHLDRMLDVFPQVSTLRIMGGITHSPVWLQMLADITGIKLEIIEIEEAGCFGVSLLSMKTMGIDIDKVYNNLPKKIIYPRVDKFDDYYKKYNLYIDLLKSLDKK
ncbi:xylulose kinase [Gallibacterium genomosp. 1]|uniref:Xylulose kinase n=2 Tax=Gallibacterium genomosp. 1 TaxID=155515 RepID=A0AB36DYA3_9PAST|nr:FGGY-family carbohydrate kinase [Gallibacterium genomosp. 1]OBX02477.1 xylulose kinase [Gallibacterium genomosp. 1]